MAYTQSSHAAARQPDGKTDDEGLIVDTLRERQRHFAAALLNPDMPVPPGLIGSDNQLSEKRFNVYRNNVVAGLVEALKAAFPAVRRIVGDEFFAAMARVYVSLEPPRSPLMFDYGETFPDFIGTFEPAKSVPYLSDVAQLERAWVEAYHSTEAPAVDPSMLATIDARSLPQMAFTLHPSVRVVRSSFPIVQIWMMNIDGGVPTSIDIYSGGENVLVVRPIAEVEVRRLPVGAATFITGLKAGASVADATILAFHDHSNFDLAGALRDLFAANAIVGWDVREGTGFGSTARVA